MKMKIIFICLILLVATLDCRSKKKAQSKSKNKTKWIGGAIRPYSFGRPYYYSRPYYSGLYRPFWPSYYNPYFRWSWLYGLRGYPRRYIISHRRSCHGICDRVLSSCTNVRAKVGATGNLSCVCEEDGTQSEVSSYCWTPRACVRSRVGGCNTIYNALMSRVSALKKRRM